MVLYLIGLGLGDETDITVKGLNAVKSCTKVFLEAYTAILGVDQKKLEEFYGKEITIADRRMVEVGSDTILNGADVNNHAMLVVGDPLAATTHTDLMLRCRERNIPTKIIHNASIMNAVASCGLSLYEFGRTISIPYVLENETMQTSWYDKIEINKRSGLHTLCLLDIKVKEQTAENIANEKLVYEAARFMTVSEAIEQLLKVEETQKNGVITEDTLCIGLARVGRDDQMIISGKMKDVMAIDFGGPLHSLVITGNMELYEEDMFYVIHWDQENAQKEKQIAREEQAEQKQKELELRRLERQKEKERRIMERKEREAAKASTQKKVKTSTTTTISHNHSDDDSSESEVLEKNSDDEPELDITDLF